MSSKIKLAKLLIMYHANMVGLIDIAWLLRMIKDDRVEELKKKHFMAAVEILDKCGVDLNELNK